MTKPQNELLDEISDLANPTGVAVHGTDTNNDAPSGYIGEYIESRVTSPVNTAASATWFDAASITLTPGDWDVSEIFSVQSNASIHMQTFCEKG